MRISTPSATLAVAAGLAYAQTDAKVEFGADSLTPSVPQSFEWHETILN